jgi:hypothetical protein
MPIKLFGYTTCLIFLLTTQSLFSQTLFLGEESIGVGVQYQYTSLMGQPASSFAVGFSLNRKLDLTFSGTNASVAERGYQDAYSISAGSAQLTFFPAKEENDDQAFTGEVVTGLGIISFRQNQGLMFLLGTGFSKAFMLKDRGTNIRPRLSAGYTLTTTNSTSESYSYSLAESDRTQVNAGVTIGGELLMDFRLSKTAALILTPSLNFFPDHREAGFGFATAIVF